MCIKTTYICHNCREPMRTIDELCDTPFDCFIKRTIKFLQFYRRMCRECQCQKAVLLSTTPPASWEDVAIGGGLDFPMGKPYGDEPV